MQCTSAHHSTGGCANGTSEQNYKDGDEIFLIGFSRGAFTARSIGGLIDQVGLLTKDGLNSFYPIFKDWQNQVNKNYKPAYGTLAWPVTRPKFSDPAYMDELINVSFRDPMWYLC